MRKAVTASAPGSVMITGEHAVVHGHPAIVAAIDQRATAHVRWTDTGHVTITSQIAEPQNVPMDALEVQGPYRFAIAAVAALAPNAPGLEIDIASEIDPTLGLGSSAAVTVAVLAALAGHANDSLHAHALGIIRAIQGRGSGADLAASLRGGVLSYQVDRAAQFAPLPSPPVLSLHYVGYKTPTAEVLAQVAAARAADQDRIDTVLAQMGGCAAATIAKVGQDGWSDIGPELAAYQDLMVALGVSDDRLDAAVASAVAARGVIGAKISGSGLGDCALALGTVPPAYTQVPLAEEGVMFHDAT